MMQKAVWIRNTQLVENGVVTPCNVFIKDGKIAAITPPAAQIPASGEETESIDAKGLYLSHGFLDIHVHGGGGYDFMDATEEAWRGAAALHLRHGTTGIIPTTLASDRKSLLAAFAAYNACRSGFPDGAKFLGLHVEGPYLAPAQCGAQDPSCLRLPRPEEYRLLADACPGILRWTIAPELPGSLAMGDYLTARGILPCVGHSDATYEEVRTAMAHGFRHVTHLYSAMSTVVRRRGFRHAGIVESAYLLDGLTSEVIADGCHLPPSLLRMAYRFIGPDRLCLVTDAMRAAGQTGGTSILGSLANGQNVIIEDGVAKMPDREAFAGSICTADRLVRTMVHGAGVPLPDAVKMVTSTPARILGLSGSTGTAAVGRRADLVLFDEKINIGMAMTDGVIRFRNGGDKNSESCERR